LLIVPSLVGQLLLGAELIGIAITAARVAGIALIAFGVACWPGTPLVGMLTYNAAITLCVAYVGFAGDLPGILLGPVVVRVRTIRAYATKSLMTPPCDVRRARRCPFAGMPSQRSRTGRHAERLSGTLTRPRPRVTPSAAIALPSPGRP
jgi:hypothetical protein